MQEQLSHTVYQKLQKLVKEYEHLKKENHRLRQELEAHHSSITSETRKIEEMESQIRMLKSSLGQMDAGAKKEMERRIQHYIKDIDNAIMLLNE